MLSSSAFTTGMAILMDRFGRPLQPPTLKMYYAALSTLTDAEFAIGVERVIAEREFFPPANILIDAARPPVDHALDAEDSWEDVRRRIRNSPWRFIGRGEFSPHEWAAIAAVGGLEAIANMTLDAEPHVHRRFAEAYVSRVTSRDPALAIEGEIEPRVSQLVSDVAKRIGVAKEPPVKP